MRHLLLGVVLFQMVVGDLSAAFGSGWEPLVRDELLRDNIARCVDLDPNRRFQSAAELAQRLRGLEARRAAIVAEREMEQRREAERILRRRLRIALGVLIAITAGALVIANRERVVANRERDLRNRADQEARAAREAEKQKGLALQREKETTRSLKQTQARFFIDRAMEHENKQRLRTCLLDLWRAWRVAPPDDPLRESAAILFPYRTRRAGFPLLHDGPVEAVGFRESPEEIVTAGGNRIYRWEPATGAPVGTPLTVAHGYRMVNFKAFSPDGRFVAAAATGTRQRVWSLETGTAIAITGGSELVTAMATSPDGTQMLPGDLSGMVQVHDARTDASLGPQVLLPGVPIALAFTPLGPRAVVTSEATTLEICDCATGQPTGAQLRLSETPSSIVFSTSGTVLATITGRTAYLWETTTGRAVGELVRLEETVTSVAFSPDGKRVITGIGGGGVSGRCGTTSRRRSGSRGGPRFRPAKKSAPTARCGSSP